VRAARQRGQLGLRARRGGALPRPRMRSPCDLPRLVRSEACARGFRGGSACGVRLGGRRVDSDPSRSTRLASGPRAAATHPRPERPYESLRMRSPCGVRHGRRRVDDSRLRCRPRDRDVGAESHPTPRPRSRRRRRAAPASRTSRHRPPGGPTPPRAGRSTAPPGAIEWATAVVVRFAPAPVRKVASRRLSVGAPDRSGACPSAGRARPWWSAAWRSRRPSRPGRVACRRGARCPGRNAANA